MAFTRKDGDFYGQVGKPYVVSFLAAASHSWPIPAIGPPTAEGEAEQFEMSNWHSWRIESPGGSQGEVGGHQKMVGKPRKYGPKGRVNSPFLNAGFYFLEGGEVDQP